MVRQCPKLHIEHETHLPGCRPSKSALCGSMEKGDPEARRLGGRAEVVCAPEPQSQQEARVSGLVDQCLGETTEG